MNITIEPQDYAGDGFHLIPSLDSQMEGRSLNISIVDNINSVVDSIHTVFTRTASFIQIASFNSYRYEAVNSVHSPFLSFGLTEYPFSQLLLNNMTNAFAFFQPQDSSQDWFWTSEWQVGEQLVDEELASGQFERFESGEAFLQALRERGKRDANL